MIHVGLKPKQRQPIFLVLGKPYAALKIYPTKDYLLITVEKNIWIKQKKQLQSYSILNS